MPRTLPFDPGRSDLQIVRLYQLVTRGGVTVRLADADHDVTIVSGGPTTYLALPGVKFSEITFSDDGRANICTVTATMESGGMFDPADVALGKFASAAGTVNVADLSDLSASSEIFRGIVSDQTYSEDQTSITIELRSDIALARSVVVDTFGPLCRAYFGDYVNPTNRGQCKIPVKPDDVIRSHLYAVGDFYRARSASAGNPTDYANRYYEVTAVASTAMTAGCSRPMTAWSATPPLTAMSP
jgi:hypothetical protein